MISSSARNSIVRMVRRGGIGASAATILFVWGIFKNHFTVIFKNYIEEQLHKLLRFVSPYIDITFHEFNRESYYGRSEVFAAIKNYLSTKVASSQASSFKADFMRNSTSLMLSMDDHEEVTDEFRGVKVWWVLEKNIFQTRPRKYYHPNTVEESCFKLSFLRWHKELITESYIDHVVNEGKAVGLKNRQRRLYSNNRSNDKINTQAWSFVYFDHPATFDTLAMESKKKEEIMSDLKKFSEGKEYYAQMGKAWKRGYLLNGPPGTGKSTLIAAIANFLNYDVYDLELTTVKDNSELRSLLIATRSKSLIVMEDIDCSLNITGQRQKKEGKGKKSDGDSSKSSEVTLSGLLNFLDGLWSASGGERIIVFTTNYVHKLDPALIRRGRMDRHIEMSYCGFEAFKVLAKNYLGIESHELFAEIGSLLVEINMTPADVAEHIMPKSLEQDAESCLNNLIEALKKVKNDEERKNTEKEAQSKTMKEEKEKENCTEECDGK